MDVQSSINRLVWSQDGLQFGTKYYLIVAITTINVFYTAAVYMNGIVSVFNVTGTSFSKCSSIKVDSAEVLDLSFFQIEQRYE